MLLMGIDLGTSSVKVSVVDSDTQQVVASSHYPRSEAKILSPFAGWAEQDPQEWWHQVQRAIIQCHSLKKYNPAHIGAIGIAYQMHGLVMIDSQQQPLRNAIIWCDSRAVETGKKAFEEIGEHYCLTHLLNSPGNFTASKLAWVKEHEPAVYERTKKIMLPGDFIAMKFTGNCTTTVQALSEGIFWDFKKQSVSKELMTYFGFDHSMFPPLQSLFSPHGFVRREVASALSLKEGIPVSYKAGDQINNALSLKVLHQGDVAANAGTSGVIYAVGNDSAYDAESRINSFAHFTYEDDRRETGSLLCINGTGSFYRWVKGVVGLKNTYSQLNEMASLVPAGSEGVIAIPFGNGAERMLNNRKTGAHFHNFDFSKHTPAHIIRATQEGIAYSFRYGLDIMRENGVNPKVIRAGYANLFLSSLFAETLVNVCGVPVELHHTDGSAGAALGAGLGAGIYNSYEEAFSHRQAYRLIEPVKSEWYNQQYNNWKKILTEHLIKR